MTSTPRTKAEMSSPSSSTRPGGRRTPTRLARAPSASSLSRSTRAQSAASVTARYIAPVSSRRQPSRSASVRATVLLPAPAGPSIVTTRRMVRCVAPLTEAFTPC